MTTALVQGPLSDPVALALLKENFVCVQESLPPKQIITIRLEDLPEAQRARLAPFFDGRFHVGTAWFLSPDGKTVLSKSMAWPGGDRNIDDFLTAARKAI